jgi:hypothetical protein
MHGLKCELYVGRWFRAQRFFNCFGSQLESNVLPGEQQNRRPVSAQNRQPRPARERGKTLHESFKVAFPPVATRKPLDMIPLEGVTP